MKISIYQLPTIRSPGFVEQLTLFMHNYINSQNQYEKFLILTKKLVLNRVLTAESTATWLQDIEMKLKDDEWNNIKEWFGVNDEQTSSTIPTSTEDTTLNAVTPSTSIRIITICISLGFLLTRIYAWVRLIIHHAVVIMLFFHELICLRFNRLKLRRE